MKPPEEGEEYMILFAWWCRHISLKLDCGKCLVTLGQTLSSSRDSLQINIVLMIN